MTPNDNYQILQGLQVAYIKQIWLLIIDRSQPNATFKEQDDNQPDIYETRKRHSLGRDKEVK